MLEDYVADPRVISLEAMLPMIDGGWTVGDSQLSHPAESAMTSRRSGLTLSHRDILSRWFSNTFSSFSLHDIATASHDSTRMLMDPRGPLMGWGTLGGYMIAVGIGVGLVAGEVVAARVFGITRR